jgi:hypothetical protein
MTSNKRYYDMVIFFKFYEIYVLMNEFINNICYFTSNRLQIGLNVEMAIFQKELLLWEEMPLDVDGIKDVNMLDMLFQITV